MAWEIWSNDYFDRDAYPSLEAAGDDLVAGFTELWRKTVAEGVMADGRPTFTWFQLRWEGGGLSLPRDPFSNPELAKLQLWQPKPEVITALAKSLATQAGDARSRQLLELVAMANDPGDLYQRLGRGDLKENGSE